MKEDVLEQIVEDYLQYLGYFTRHNVRFRPSSTRADFEGDKDRVYSDVDVVGIHPRQRGTARVWVVSCKAWQSGFYATRRLQQLEGLAKNPKRPTWMHHRELWEPKWSEAFIDAIEAIAGTRRFQYSIAVTELKGDGGAWARHPRIRKNLEGNPFSFLEMSKMWREILAGTGTTPASSEIGRLAQLLKAAGLA